MKTEVTIKKSGLAVVSDAHLPHIVNPERQCMKNSWQINRLTSPVILLHKGIGGDGGEADADEEVDEEVGNETKVEDGSQ